MTALVEPTAGEIQLDPGAAFPSSTLLNSGNYAVAWLDMVGTSKTLVQLFSSDGSASGSPHALNDAINYNAVAPLASGGFVVAYTTNSQLLAQIFDPSGTPQGSAVPLGSIDYYSISTFDVAELADGGFAASWRNGSTVSVHTFNASGGSVATLTADVGAGGSAPQIVQLTNGTIALTWHEYDSLSSYSGGYPDGYQVAAQLFSATGTALSSKLLVNESELGSHAEPKATALTGGGFVVTWVANGGDDPGILGQVYDAAGNAMGPNIHISDLSPGYQSQSDVTALPWGGFLVAWADDSSPNPDHSGQGIRAQLFDATGAAVGETFQVDAQHYADDVEPSVVAVSPSKAAIFYRSSGDPSGLLERMIDLPTVGTPNDDILNGTAGADRIDGLAGNDSISGGNGDDAIYGGAGNDTLNGDAGNDTLNGGVGSDSVNGGDGDDSITAVGASTSWLFGDLGNDRIVASDGVYQIFGDSGGSAATDGNDTITLTNGGSGSWVDGGGGDDTITAAGDGSITLGGGLGNDSITINGFASGHIVLGPGADISNDDDVLNIPVGLFTIDLGYGQDAVKITATGAGFVTITGFNAGEQGDRLDLSIYGADPFGDGTLVLSQYGPDAIIDDSASGMRYVIDNVVAANLSAFNLGVPNPAYAPVGLSLAPEHPEIASPVEYVGADGDDLITGSAGGDRLFGSGGNDTINGSAGDDLLSGGGGQDTLTGGAGHDTFQFRTTDGGARDTITDFSVGDKIVIADATLSNFSYSLSGNVLTYTDGSVTLDSVPPGSIVARAAAGGGVQLTVEQQAVHNDVNGDGLSDILWRNDNGQFNIWQSTGNGNFVTSFASSIAGPDWHIQGTGDFNGDGREDIVWRNDSGQVNIWEATGSGDFITSFTSTIAGNDWHIVGSGDFNGDGMSDLLWRNDNGQLNEWQATANGNFVTAFTSNIGGPDWHVSGAGDFNGDGLSDIVWRNDSGQVNIWEATGSGDFVTSFSSTIADNDWHIAGLGDFNGDTLADVLWRNDSGQFNEWTSTAGGGFVTSYSAMVGTDWHLNGTGDFNGDGMSDLVWRNDSGTTDIWKATGDGNFAPGYYTTSIADTHWHVQDPFL